MRNSIVGTPEKIADGIWIIPSYAKSVAVDIYHYGGNMHNPGMLMVHFPKEQILELSKSSVNCLPRGVPAIWLQNPYSTMIIHTPTQMAQLYEVLNNWRLIHTDGRPLPKYPKPFFHGNSTTRWEGTRWSSNPSGSTSAPTSSPTGGFTARI